jgi:hypothetical protein
MVPPVELVALAFRDAMSSACSFCGRGEKRREDQESYPMTLNEALAVKARGLTKEQIIAHLRAVAENNLRADIRTIERAWKEKP